MLCHWYGSEADLITPSTLTQSPLLSSLLCLTLHNNTENAKFTSPTSKRKLRYQTVISARETFIMQLKQLTALALAGVVSGQSLTDVIGQNQDLSQLGTLLGQYPDLAQTLGGLSNITVLAPNNAALSALLNDSSVTAAVAADPGLVPASKCGFPLPLRRRPRRKPSAPQTIS